MTAELSGTATVCSGSAAEGLAAAFPAISTDTRGVRVLREQVQQLQARIARRDHWQRLLAAMCQADDMPAAVHQAASELQRQWGAVRVAIGVRSWVRPHVRLAGLSDVVRFSPRSDLVRKLEAAMDEAARRKELTAWSGTSAENAHTFPAHRQLGMSLGNTPLVTVPLLDSAGECWGAIVAMGVDPPAGLNAILDFTESASGSLASVLLLWRRCTAWPLQRLARVVWGHGRRRRTAALLAAAAGVAAVLCLPLPYRMTCECDVQPVSRRFVVAPFDGALEETLAAPGDRVRAGQTLARLDGREIRCEMATTEAEYQRASKERDAALANGQTAAAQMARLEMSRLDLKIQLLQQRARELEIRSPIDGLLISGDWDRARGARMSIGQTLFEIGPLDRMVVEIALPEDDVRFARPGAPVEVQVNAVAGKTWMGTLDKIHPRAEIRDSRNVFIAEMTLENADGALLPGMKGTARIVGPTRWLGWNLFHKPWYAVRRWLGV